MKWTVFLLALFFGSCGNSKTEEFTPLVTYVKKSKKDITKYKAIVIVPSQGCGGCITGAESFVLNDYLTKNGKNLLFVITGHDSKKSANIRFGYGALNNCDVIVDYNHQFDRPPYIVEYPKVLFLKSSIISDVKEIKPADHAIYKKLEDLMN